MSRPFDLPPKWDGASVEWLGEWEEEPWTSHRFHAPLADFACRNRCGSLAPRLTRRGVVGDPSVTAIHRLLLYVTRCPDCGHDTVLRLDTDEAWDLDDTDYGPDGSYDETKMQGELF